METGTIITLTEEQKQATQPIRDVIKDEHYAMRVHSGAARRANEALWRSIYEMKPDLQDFDLILLEDKDGDPVRVRVIGKRMSHNTD